MSTAMVQVKGVTGIRRALRPLLEPEIDKELDAATKAAANVYAKALRPELRQVSRRMARAVRVKRARKDRPGWVVGSRRKLAFFWPFVIGGTRAHGPRKARVMYNPNANPPFVAKHVRGVRPNPIVERVAARVEGRAFAEAESTFDKGTGL
jgi:hypothetical protein